MGKGREKSHVKTIRCTMRTALSIFYPQLLARLLIFVAELLLNNNPQQPG